MTDHEHGPDCGIPAMVVGPFTSPPVLVVVITRDDLATGGGHVQSTAPEHVIPELLRALADKLERQHKARLS